MDKGQLCKAGLPLIIVYFLASSSPVAHGCPTAKAWTGEYIKKKELKALITVRARVFKSKLYRWMIVLFVLLKTVSNYLKWDSKISQKIEKAY